MDKDIGNYRKTYKKGKLSKANTPEDPMSLFQQWFYEAEAFGEQQEVNAMSLATVGADEFPKSRIVLLKRFTWEGFIFYTNYQSDKGKAIAVNPKVCLSFFWAAMERQVIIRGIAEKISENMSDGYFESRPEGSRLSVWASHQSEAVASRELLEERLKYYEKKYEEKEIPRPEYWGGYLVRPQSIEFWQGRPNRLHDRILYQLKEDFNWSKERLAP